MVGAFVESSNKLISKKTRLLGSSNGRGGGGSPPFALLDLIEPLARGTPYPHPSEKKLHSGDFLLGVGSVANAKKSKQQESIHCGFIPQKDETAR